jgi:Flp pilus assembly CpaF family ATPase
MLNLKKNLRLSRRDPAPTNDSDDAEFLLSGLIEKISTDDIQEIYLNHQGVLSCLRTDGYRSNLGDFCSTSEVMDLAWKIAWDSGVRLDPFCPFAGGIVKGRNLRWHAVIPPAAPDGPMLVVRKQSLFEVSLTEFKLENFSECDILRWQQTGVSVVFFGPTGCGKTTLLFSLLKRHFLEFRVGIVESVMELPLASPAWFRLVQVGQDLGGKGAIDFERIVAEMLRLSPQLIVLGEIRGAEAYVWSELSRTGHGGILTTFHAGSTAEARSRLYENVRLSPSTGPTVIGVHIFRDHLGTYRCRSELISSCSSPI